MLTEIFGMEWYKVHDEAEQMEHAVSADFENRLREKLGEEESCPHGNRVAMDRPQDRRARGWKPLDEISGGGPAQVTSVLSATDVYSNIWMVWASAPARSCV